MCAGAGHKRRCAPALPNRVPLPHPLAELRAHFEPASETEGVDKDTDEAEEDYPQADLPGRQAHAFRGSSPPSAGASQPQQLQHQHLSLQLGELRQETNRWAGVGRSPGPVRESVALLRVPPRPKRAGLFNSLPGT